MLARIAEPTRPRIAAHRRPPPDPSKQTSFARPARKALFVLEWRRHTFGAAMTNPENSKPLLMDVPAFLRDPRPSERLRCPTLLVAWLRAASESSQTEPECRRGNTDEDRP